MKTKLIKKDGTTEEFNAEKIKVAITKSANRVMVTLTDEQKEEFAKSIYDKIAGREVTISEVHNLVEQGLETLDPKVAKSYRDYRNYKKDFIHILDKVYEASQHIRFIGDKENSNSDSSLVATKRCLIFNELNKRLYRKFFMTKDELTACKAGYIYIHDQSARLDSINCCLADISNIMSGGFEMGNVWYNEPKTLDTAFDVMGDIILSSAAQQYGGFTIPEVDKVLEPYAEKSFKKYCQEWKDIIASVDSVNSEDKMIEYALKKVERDFEQGFQGIEMKLNTVGSSRGDYPFITMTFGLSTSRFGRLASKTFLRVHKEGQGKEGFKKPVLFPKLVFLYDEEIHGEGKINYDVFLEGIECSSKTMYPDWLSLSGDGYVAEMYKKYKRVVSPMGCVDGKEVITYKFHDKLYVESFERMWGRITSEIKDRGQRRPSDIHRVVDLTESDVLIYDTLKGFVKVKYLIRNFQDNWCDVTISNGRKLRTTLDHPFETERGTVLARDLTTDDAVTINTKQYAEDTIDIPTDLAWLQGFMLCDGCYQNYSVFASIASEGEDDIEKYFKQSMENHFSTTPVTLLQERGCKGTYKDLRVYSDGSTLIKDLTRYFTELFGGVQKKYRHIPNEVFSYSRESKYSFLAGMIDADGYINDDVKKHKYPTVQIGSTNKELALQQLLLAQSLGMRARLYTNHYSVKDKNKVRYRVEFFPNRYLINAMQCKKKKSKWTHFIDEHTDLMYGHIVDVEPLKVEQFSYDVTTESEHFEVSGVYSHNCRAFLSPYFEKGGLSPADSTDKPVFVGRFNIGAVSLNLPMILAKARRDSADFYEVLDYYLEMIRGIHQRTYDYLGEMKASINPVMFCEGGFYGGNLKPTDKIKPILKSATASFGFTALNELQSLYNGKSIREDGNFALEVLKHINEKIAEYKNIDNHLYAIYGTPAENLCFTGDTLVQTYGGDKQIKDLTTEDLVYSFNEEKHKVELKRVIGSKKTVSNANIVEIKFDNGQTIRCTPNHRFAVRVSNKDTLNGKFIGSEFIEWVEAQNLKDGDRIKSNYIELNQHGRPQCSIYYKGKHQLIQDINAEYTLGEKPLGCVVHHSDEDKENNLFSNLEYLTDTEHKRLHMKNTIEKYKHTSESQSGVNNSFYGKHHSEDSKKKNKEAHIGNSVEVFDLSMKHLCHYECIGDAERDGFTRHLIKKSCEGNRDHLYKNMYWFYTKDCESLLEQNHKVVSVTYLNYTEDVYDIEVEDNHNFFVGGSQGLLVHNCGLQIEQFRKEFGIVENVSDRPYVSNSFHCHVTEDMSPIEKQDCEKRFWDYANGGKIQYVRYPLSYNKEAVKTLVLRAMKMGFYEGVNLSLAYCDDCGYQQLEMDVCPKCGSNNLTKVDRMNGYLSYSRVKGDTRLNKAKMAEIADRVSM